MKIFTTTIIALFLATASFSQTADNNITISKPLYIPSEKTVTYKIGNKSIPIKVIQYGSVKDIVCINMHDNEDAALEAAIAVLEVQGGTLIKVENNGQRVIRFKLGNITYGFDPNRIYSRIGIHQTLRDNKRTNPQAVVEIEKFAQYLLSFIPDSTSCIVALHNNTEGLFSIKSYTTGGERQRDAKAVFENPAEDIDDIAFTTDSLLYQKMSEAGYNTIWQDNEKAKKDGSLSIFCGERNRRYINIETQHGKVVQYIKMMESLYAVLVSEKIKPTLEPENKLEQSNSF